MVAHEQRQDEPTASTNRRSRAPAETVVTEPDPVLEGRLQMVLRRLLDEFRGTADTQRIRREFAKAYAQQGTARIRTYVPIFTYRAAREALRKHGSSSAA